MQPEGRPAIMTGLTGGRCQTSTLACWGRGFGAPRRGRQRHRGAARAQQHSARWSRHYPQARGYSVCPTSPPRGRWVRRVNARERRHRSGIDGQDAAATVVTAPGSMGARRGRRANGRRTPSLPAAGSMRCAVATSSKSQSLYFLHFSNFQNGGKKQKLLARRFRYR